MKLFVQKPIVLFAAICSLLSLSLSSCREADTTAPTIVVTEPAQNDTIEAGEELCIQVTFTDDVALNSYKINVHSNFNGHKHVQGRDNKSAAATVDFETTLTSQMLGDSLTGRNCFRDIDIDIPENATPGNYHLLIYCTDLAGNEAYTARDLIIK